jgi:hypothetical protein
MKGHNEPWETAWACFGILQCIELGTADDKTGYLAGSIFLTAAPVGFDFGSHLNTLLPAAAGLGGEHWNVFCYRNMVCVGG